MKDHWQKFLHFFYLNKSKILKLSFILLLNRVCVCVCVGWCKLSKSSDSCVLCMGVVRLLAISIDPWAPGQLTSPMASTRACF
jgi:hypothetical protein